MFLDNNPFTPTHEGISFLDYEAKSSKFGGNEIVNKLEKKGATILLGKVLIKVIGKSGGQLLSTTELTEQESYENKQFRTEDCKNRLIEHVFRKQIEYQQQQQQQPSMYNGYQSTKTIIHSSIYDKLNYRYY